MRKKLLLLVVLSFLIISGGNASAAISNASKGATVPELPLSYVDTSMPGTSSTCTINVSKGGNLQSAIDKAQLGDTICLEAGATFTGSFVLTTKKTGSGWVTIRTSTPDNHLPGSNIRINPNDAPKLAKVVSPGQNTPVFLTDTATHNYRLIGLEVTKAKPTDAVSELVILGDSKNSQLSSSQTDTLSSELPYNIILDRLYIHGDSTSDLKRGVRMNCNNCAIINSYISDIHVVGQDSQAIATWNSSGPFKIVNNYIEAAAENILFGGSDPTIKSSAVVSNETTTSASLSSTAALHVGEQIMFTVGGVTGENSFTTVRSISGNNITFDSISTKPDSGSSVYWGTVPSDIEVRGNYFLKPLSWKVGEASYAGHHWSVKNIFETKSAQRMLVDGNIFENSWTDGQTGIGIVLKSTNQDGSCVWCISQDITFTNNIIKNTENPVSLNGHESYSATSKQPPNVKRIKISNNLIFNDADKKEIHNTFFVGNEVFGLEISHNTAFANNMPLLTNSESPVKNSSFVFTNNIIERGTYGIGAGSDEGKVYLDKYFPSAVYSNNVLINSSAGTGQSVVNSFLTNKYGAGATVVSGRAGANFNNLSSNDFGLSSVSLLKNGATDGKDIGVDTLTLNNSVSNVKNGGGISEAPLPVPAPVPTPAPSPSPEPTPSPAPSPVPTPIPSGGGGGGGGGSYISPQPIYNSVSSVVSPVSPVYSATPLTNVSGTTTSTAPILTISRTLSIGDKGDDVKMLQVLLMQKGYLTSDSLTGYFGSITEAAIKKYQCDNAIVCSGTANSTGYGVVDTKTAAKLNFVYLNSSTAIPTTIYPAQSLSSTTPSSLNLSRNLYVCAKGNDVVNLQNYLIQSGYLSAGNNTGYYGNLTSEAVKQFQCAKGIVCSGNSATTGWGSIGPKTRAFLAKI